MSFAIWALGSNGSGQLGLGHLDDVSTPTRCIFSPSTLLPLPTARPVSIAAGGNHTIILFSDGSAYTAGCNDDGRCGLPPTIEPITTFTRISFKTRTTTTAQSPTQGMIDKFSSVAATWSASIFTTSHAVYSCGSGDHGELGLGVAVTRAPTPIQLPIQADNTTHIVSLNSSFRHVIASLADGKYYGWGSGRKGQLGAAQSKDGIAWSPHLVWHCEEEPEKVVCGKDFGLLVGNVGQEYKLLGLEKEDKFGVRRDVPSVEDMRDCLGLEASWNSVHLLKRDGGCLSWGRGDKNQLVPEVLKARKFNHLKAGSEHVVATLLDDQTASEHVVAWGWGEHGNCGPVNERGEAEGGYNVIGAEIPGHVKALGAGCATTFLLSEPA